MSKYNIREANVDDINFIVKAILEAEKSGSQILSYSKVFNLNEQEIINIFLQILREENEVCEFSLSTYLIAETDDKVVGTIGAWVEHYDTVSALNKSNILGYYLPKSSILYAIQKAKITSELYIEHTKDALSLVVVYINPEHRGNNLFGVLTDEHIKRNKNINELSIQVMSNNLNAIRAYEKYGFKKCFTKKSDNSEILNFLPYNEKILMKKSI